MSHANVSRRTFIATAASATAALILPASGIPLAPNAVTPKPLPPIDIVSLYEYEGDGQFGSLSTLYARGHIDPLHFAEHIDGDEVFEMLGDNAYDPDDNELPDEQLTALIAAKVEHRYGRYRNRSCSCQTDQSCDDCAGEAAIFLTCTAEHPDAFPVTIIAL
jgi:hypothetical protein